MIPVIHFFYNKNRIFAPYSAAFLSHFSNSFTQIENYFLIGLRFQAKNVEVKHFIRNHF